VIAEPRPGEGRRALRASSVTVGAVLGLWCLAIAVMALVAAVAP
jgi:hypothetical protein